jgi:hypothetical protein
LANDKLYIHEFIDIIGHNRAKYMHHITANWSPIAQVERHQLCFGVYGTVGSTRRWPEVVNIWEEDGWAGMARSFAHEFGHPTLQDPSLAAWWAEAAKYRSAGVDRLLVPAPWTRPIEELCAAGVRGVAYAHELIRCVPGSSQRYLSLLRDEGLRAHEKWSFEAWGEFEAAQRRDEGLARWRSKLAGTAIDWNRFLLVDAPLSPLRIGRQPAVSDRKPLSEIP